ncbi:MAG: cell wall-binding repeat-containing protein [Finegoldia magna]|uniref:cell wall-binding repeat-containing protein n=1 Tax=Finegoldia magna TaxID=1260 RepID=UPI0026EE6E70|nr:cell wall-binding repeat-containing protein [Finegoldia magna]MBS5777460.1 cell wall-binding repeat-containing protein [Finegoldia magna]MDU2574966.1 cell wall-binding repeat-containing protein [Finegoldia magna]MDU7478950.1 cell wall-binding repeat-containing protein [Finegoldia magna]
MKKLVALMLACMLSFPVVSVADKDSANEGASEKVEANANDTAKKSDSNAKTKDTNEKKQEEITTNEDGVFKNVIHQRFQGENRAKTAVNVQRHYFANTNKVILVNDNAYPDAISATNVSMGKYPLLYTGKNSLSVETKLALDKMFLDEIYLMGGVNTISKKVENNLRRNFPHAKITRIMGNNRYDTSAESAKTRAHTTNLIFAAGTNYADALYATSLAAHQKAPILLVSNDGLSTSTVNFIKSIGNIDNVTIVGGEISVNQSVKNQIENLTKKRVTRLAGQDRYASSVEVAKRVNANPAEVITTSGEVFADALVSSTVAQKIKAPILLVKKDVLPLKVREYMKDTNSIYKLTTIGGYNTVTKNNYSTQVILISGLDIDKPLLDKQGKGLIKAFTKDYKKYYVLPNNKYYNSIKKYDKLFVYLRDALAEDYRPLE